MKYELSAHPGLYEEGDAPLVDEPFTARLLETVATASYAEIVVHIDDERSVMLMRSGDSFLLAANNLATGQQRLYSPRDDDSQVTLLVGGQPDEVARGSVLSSKEAMAAFKRTIDARGEPSDDRWRDL